MERFFVLNDSPETPATWCKSYLPKVLMHLVLALYGKVDLVDSKSREKLSTKIETDSLSHQK
jgi:hypothetical protein